MKIKTIEKIINKKFDTFLSSIDDKKTAELVKKNTIITGGCIASMLLDEKVNDFDFYFSDIETVRAVVQYYLNKFNKLNDESGTFTQSPEGRITIEFPNGQACKEKGLNIEDFHELGDVIVIKEDTGVKYRPIFISSNAITLSSQVQLIVRFYGNATNIHENYDFIHCTNYWTSKDRTLVLNQKALESIISKDLLYVGSLYPLASIIRIRKFINRGWIINAGQIVKMAYQVSLLDLNDVKVLKDQLIGVDLAYFAELIEAIKSIPIDTKLNYGYISRIIDKIF